MSKLKDLWQELETHRDELKVKMHLAKAELKDEWEELENKKWPAVEAKFKALADEVEDSAEDLQHGAQVIGTELKEAYGRIRTRLKEDTNKDD
tara:strand:+ start:314 stop:592 length:279 start_codon:yes stop_codon:yes gene_type:complete